MCVSAAAGGVASFVMSRKARDDLKDAAERRLEFAKESASRVLEFAAYDRLDAGRRGQVAVGDVLSYYASSGFDVGGGNAARAIDQTGDVFEDEQLTIARNAQLEAWRIIVSGEAAYEEGMNAADRARRHGNVAVGTGVASSVSSAMLLMGTGGQS